MYLDHISVKIYLFKNLLTDILLKDFAVNNRISMPD